MNDFEEQRGAQDAPLHITEPWDENEVQIEDLGAPDRGLDLLLFSWGKNLHAALVRWRPASVALMSIVCLLALLLLPGSTLLSPPAPAPGSASSLPQQQSFPVTCVYITINPTDVTTWLRQVAPASPGKVVILNCRPVRGTRNKR